MPTGIVEAITLPHSLRWEPAAKEAAAQVCDATGIAGEPLQALCARLESLRAQIGLPASFRVFGIEEPEFLSKLAGLSEKVAQHAVFSKSERRPSEKEAETILRQAYYGS
ncbi:hypothetical protein SDC9_92388 [bioreactor metagenome]|uniref:Uncharacterized protein n=1 Tax=bioreactor metagenome TaxID=1076179 RepID=A0A644ZY70_9ZZZZ